MQKHKIWIMIAIIVILIAGLLYWLMPKDPSTDISSIHSAQHETQLPQQNHLNANGQNGSIFLSQSQQDTEINCQIQLDSSNHLQVNEQTRNCFEYFLTQYGEKTIDQIQNDFKHYIQQNYKEPAQSQILDLWNRYLDYRKSLGELTPPTEIDQNDPAYYRSIFNSTQNLRKKFFSNYEIDGLFGPENTYHVYTLQRMEVLADKNLTEVQKAQKLKALFDQLPEDWKENLEQINKLEDLHKLTSDIKTRQGSSEEIRQMRLNLVGADATQRLETLDIERLNWKNSVNDYLTKRDNINQSSMNQTAKNQAIQTLRSQQFKSAEDRLRLETFEQIHDQGGKLPFAD